jgi:16S rRNA (uracil1498-N3)-methyltransferase
VGESVRATDETAHHLAGVLRVRVNDSVALFDGEGNEARATIAHIRGRGKNVEIEFQLIEAPRTGIAHDASSVIWMQGYPKADKLETVVKQSTELGAKEIWPVYTARSVPRPKGRTDGSRTERLRAIAMAAATQCGRSDVPLVRDAMDLGHALEALPVEATLRLVPWENGGQPLARAISEHSGSGACAVLVGPEGGLETDEVARAKEHGFIAVDLGPRIWRTETVAPALLAALSLARGDLRGA